MALLRVEYWVERMVLPKAVRMVEHLVASMVLLRVAYWVERMVLPKAVMMVGHSVA